MNIKPYWLALALLLYWCELWLRIHRWQYLMSHLADEVRVEPVAVAFLAGYAANNILPAKLGELFRVDLFGRMTGIPRLSVLGSVILERLLDVAVIVSMAAWGILVVAKSDFAGQVSDILRVVASILLLTVVVTFLLIRTRAMWGQLLFVRLRDKIHSVVDGLHLLGDITSWGRLIWSSSAIWLLNSIAIWLILLSLNISLTFGQAMLLMGVIGISAAIPAAPAGIGTLQYAFYLVFAFLHLPTSVGVVASVIVQLLLLGSATAIGGWAYHYALTAYLKPVRK